jgi:hypothetical protein
MIHPDCFQKPWIDEQAAALKVHRNGLELLERCMVALELVGRLSDGGLDFVFKGGTSLVLLLQPLRRLSIDVDIVTPESLERLQAVLATVTRAAPFLGIAEHQIGRDRDAPPTRHFKIPFRSATNLQGQSHVQLDVISSAHIYPATARRRVEAPFIRLETEAHVQMPTIECLLGDKLAAFAPTTIGVLYDPINRHGEPAEPQPQRILKQLFDVHHLFAEAVNFAEVEASYRATFAVQNIYRGGRHTLDGCLDDTIAAAREISLLPEAAGATHTDRQTLLRRGHVGLTTHVVGEPFALERHTKVAAARAALLATALRHGCSDIVPKEYVLSVPPPAELSLIQLSPENAAIQTRLRSTAAEALYYWSSVEDIIALSRDAAS